MKENKVQIFIAIQPYAYPRPHLLSHMSHYNSVKMSFPSIALRTRVLVFSSIEQSFRVLFLVSGFSVVVVNT